jgi:phosphatidylserine synthase
LSSALARSRKPRAVQEWLCEWLFRPLAHVVVLALAPLRVPPPAVVLAASATGVLAAVELARGELVVAALLLQAKTILDNADGQLARLTGRVTALGRYLDSLCDLVVDAALFAGLAWYTGQPVVAAAGFVALTALLSLNFNAERIYRGATPSPPERVPVLTGLYSLLYGWHDRIADRFVRPDRPAVAVLAQLGMSTQLLTFGLCMAVGQPAAYAWLVFAELALAVVLVRRREAYIPETEGVA